MKLLTPVTPRRLGLLLASTLLVLAASPAKAGYDFWAGSPDVGATTNWTDGANWTDTVQTYYNEVEFLGAGASPNTSTAVNNVLDGTSGVSQMPIWELDYAPTNLNYTTLINPGVTLTLGAGRGWLVVGADQLTTASPAPANAVETITITGAGAALSMAGNLYVNQGSSTPGDSHNVTLDLSGLDNFTDGGSEILVASGGAPRTHGTLYLARTNRIALGDDFLICNQSFSNSVSCAVYLGQANSILTGSGNLTIGGFGTTTAGAWMKFNPAFVGGPNVPTASIGGTASDGRVINFWIGNANGGPQVAGAALCDLTGGSVSVLARTMQLGQAGNSGANAQGVLTFDDGVVDVNNATIGNQEVSGGGMGVGVVNLNSNSVAGMNATLRVNNTLTLAAVTGSMTPGTAGSIYLTGGALSAANIVNGGGATTIASTNGTISITGVAGSPAAPIGALTLVNSTLNFAAGPSTTNVFAGTFTTGGTTNVINIASVLPSPAYPVTIHLVKYTGSIGGAGYNFGLGSLPLLTSGHLSNNSANNSIDLVLTAGPLTDTWTGLHSGDWDTTTANWSAGGPVTYSDGAFVQFLDGSSASTVNLTTALAPGGITVSNTALNYTFDGIGKIGGGISLNKLGTGTLILDNSGINDFTGGVNIGNGTLQIGNGDTSGNLPTGGVNDNGTLAYDRADDIALNNAISGTGGFSQEGSGTTLTLSGGNTFSGQVLVTNGSTLKLASSTALGLGGAAIVADGSTLDVNGYTATKTLIVAGAGVNGNGALTSSGTIYDNPGPGAATNIVLSGDTTFTFPTRWDLGSASGGSVLTTDGHGYNLTLNSSSGYFEWNNLSVQSPLSNIVITAGNLGVVGATTFGDPNGTLVLSPNAGVTFYGPNVFLNKQVDFQNGASIAVGSGNNLMNGAMTLEAGFCTFNIGGGQSLTLSNVLSGSGAFYQTGGNGTATLWGNSPLFTGGVLLFNGQMNLNGLIGSGVTSQSGTTLAGTGTANGLVDVGGAFYPGGASVAGTFTSGGGLTLESSAAVTMDLAPTTATGGGVNDLIAITGDLTANGNNITINPLTGTLASGTYVLMTYSGNLIGSFGTAATVTTSRYSLALDTSTPHQVKLIVGGAANVLAWNNNSGNNEWDVQNSVNWTNLTTHALDQFFTSDAVLLDDRGAQGPHPSTSLTIEAGQIVAPSVVTNNSTTNYTISGAGKISGGASLFKLGPSTLTINTTNDFTGNVNVAAGTLQMNGQLQGSSSPLGAASGTVSVTNGAALIVNLQGGYPAGDIGFAAKPVVISGSGVDGKGAVQIVGNPIYNDSSTLTGLGANVKLAGDAVVGGTTRWDWGYPSLGATLSTGGSNYNFTAIESGYTQWRNLTIDTNLGNFDFYQTANSQQTWAVSAMGGSLGNPTNVLTLHSNVLMDISHDSVPGDSGYAKVIHILPTAGFQYQPGGGNGDYRLGSSFIMEDGSMFAFYNGNGGSGSGTVISGPVKLNGLVHLQIGDSTVTFSNVISGAGGFYWDNYNNTVLFTATNTYQGITDIRSGRTLALGGNGSISSSTNISLAASATLDVSGRVDETLTLAAGQTLQGNGTVNGTLTASAGSTVSPGGANSIGTLTVTNAINMSASTTVIEVNKTAATQDQLNCAAAITYGGTLNVTNLSGTLTAGDSFKVFNAGSYSGGFSSIVPPPGAGLSWDPTGLTNGTLRVVSSVTQPTIGRITVSGGNIIITGQDNTGSSGTYHILTATNVSLPLSDWVVLTNGNFDASGDFSSTNALGTSARQFYILQIP
ncbi:MAG TPA: autotransporter-associated beta strand repeat-containing protein [Verrucomicrobiae bacterium]|nr:autotransporter-associated beta strand repeat-containing protein [Verrucomicrobiae bacterium]